MSTNRRHIFAQSARQTFAKYQYEVNANIEYHAAITPPAAVHMSVCCRARYGQKSVRSKKADAADARGCTSSRGAALSPSSPCFMQTPVRQYITFPRLLRAAALPTAFRAMMPRCSLFRYDMHFRASDIDAEPAAFPRSPLALDGFLRVYDGHWPHRHADDGLP